MRHRQPTAIRPVAASDLPEGRTRGRIRRRGETKGSARRVRWAPDDAVSWDPQPPRRSRLSTGSFWRSTRRGVAPTLDHTCSSTAETGLTSSECSIVWRQPLRATCAWISRRSCLESSMTASSRNEPTLPREASVVRGLRLSHAARPTHAQEIDATKSFGFAAPATGAAMRQQNSTCIPDGVLPPSTPDLRPIGSRERAQTNDRGHGHGFCRSGKAPRSISRTAKGPARKCGRPPMSGRRP